ncbi:peptidoglycan-binding protein [Pyxidicoccus trucidator]|uniref:peptidoglycan-binding protein n=1 Tax=Pyxidicoccus trucidator TaxID=2709662 RepID=UPI0013DC349D|nr:peptidoglycan-binding protein [Pyxidicoccus trucidator]
MRVDGPSVSTQSHSSQESGSVQRSEAPEPNVIREEEGTQSTGHDDVSSFEEESSSSAPRLRPPPPPPPPEPPPEEPRPVPRKDLKRGDTGEEVEALQESLVELGYLTEEQVATGPGTFGPQTEAALEKFQRDSGVSANGQYEASTREALSQARTRSAQAGGKPGPAMTAEQAFITQFTSEYNPYGPRGSTNCGPASLAMSLAYTGHMPQGLTKEQQVDHARALMSPRRESEFTYVKASDGTRVPLLNRDRELTGGTMVADGIKSAGLESRYGQGWETLDKQLAAGNPVIANGYTNAAWRSQFPERMGSGDVGHLNAILGKTADGKYLVADPLHTGGPVAMTRQQLSTFFSPTGGQPSFNALQGASRGSGAAAAGASAGAAAGAGLPKGKDADVLALLKQAASKLPVPELGTTTASAGTKAPATTQAASATPAERAAQDAKALEKTLQHSLQDGAKQFEQLVASNPDPAYQEALVAAAQPSLEKMGEYFHGVSPESNRKLHPPKGQKPVDVNNPKELDALSKQENALKYETYYSLARATEALKDPAASKVGEFFTEKMPRGFTQGINGSTLLGAVKKCIEGGVGSRLAFAMERAKTVDYASHRGIPSPNAQDLKALHETTWKAIDTIRADFTAAAEKAERHQRRLTELLSGPAAVLSPEQQQAAINTFMTPDRKKDLAEFERLSKLLAPAAPDGVPPDETDPRVKELALALPRLAETQSGAEYLAAQLEASGEGKSAFLTVVGGFKDLKDLDEKLAVGLARAAGMGAIIAANNRNLALAGKIYEGLAKHAELFGMTPDDMRSYTSVLQTLKPNMPYEQYKTRAESLNTLLKKDKSGGLLGDPETGTGQALRGLGVAVSTAAFFGDLGDWSQADMAARLKIVGDGLSAGADGSSLLMDAVVKGASNSKFLGKLSAAGAIIGAVGDAIQGFQALKDERYAKAGSSFAQAAGGTILAASAFVGVIPGLQVAGALLFVGGIGLKYLDEALERGNRVDLLANSGMDRQLAESLVHSGPEFLAEKLGKGLGMSPQDIQKFIGEHRELAGHKGYIDTLAQAASEFGMTGPNFQEFVERLSRANNNGSEDMYALGDRLNGLFFGQLPSMAEDGSFPTQSQRFRKWVETSYPDLAAWVDERHRKAAA